MSLKDIWIPQNETMDASPDIPNMLADAIIQNETDIKELQENGDSSGSELFEIQWDGTTGNKTYAEVSQAIAERKIPVLYQGNKCIATFSGETPMGIIFASTDIYSISGITEYIISPILGWEDEITGIAKIDDISAENKTFKTAVLNCFPDADTMSFPLEETISEVSEE